MKKYLYCFRENKRLLVGTLIVCLSIDLCLLLASLPNSNVQGYLIPVFLCLGFTAFIMVSLMLFTFIEARRNRRIIEIMDTQGPCEELVEAYKRRYRRLSSLNHSVLAMWYITMGNMQQAQYELTLSGNFNIIDEATRAYYSEAFVEMKIRQKRFNEAIIMYNNYNVFMESYCRRNKNEISIIHYAHGALLYACTGVFDSAMMCIRKMTKIIKRNRELAFARNTALMGVYLIMGDFSSADEIQRLMLKDIDEFNEFTFESYRALARKNIKEIQDLFDPRTQIQ